MRKFSRKGWGIAALASLTMLVGAGAGTSTAATTEGATALEAAPYIGPTTGSRTFNVALSEATQSATGVAGDPGGTGTSNITIYFASQQICATTSWSGIDSPVVAGHIHEGGYGEPEVPAVWITLFQPNFLNGVSSPASGCDIVPLPELWAINLCPAKFNVVVHSQKHAVGAIRGQLPGNCGK